MNRWLRRLARRARALFRAGAVDEEMDEEIRLHIALETEELMSLEGLTREEARRRALIAFGGIERTRVRHREARGVSWVEHRVQDIRYALRGLRARPGFALAVVTTLALGIGANSAMFSIVDRLLFRPPPMMPDAARVHRVYVQSTWRGTRNTNSAIQYARYVDLTRDTHSFERTATFTSRQLAVGTGEDTREMNVGVVGWQFFGMFDAPPALGRYFSEAEDTPPDADAVVVLSYGFWQTRYGGATDVLGRSLQVGATRYTIVGVSPRGFAGVWPQSPPAVYVATAGYGAELRTHLPFGGSSWWTSYDWTWTRMLVERKPGVSLEEANADLTQAGRRSYQAQRAQSPSLPPLEATKPTVIAASVLADRGPKESSLAKVATWVSGVALVVFLIACVNVANLLLTRALQRRREIAVRLALGVSRGRLAAQLLTESLVLALLGGVGGIALAEVGGGLLRSIFLPANAGLMDPTGAGMPVAGDPRTLLYAGATALLGGFLAGLAPLVRTRHADLTHDLREGVRGGTRQHAWLRGGMLLFQGTLSVVLLVGAGLFVRSLVNVQTLRLGYDPAQVADVGLNMRGVRLDSADQVALLDQLRETAAEVPGVTHVARHLTMPFWSTVTLDLHVEGIDSVSRLGEFDMNQVSPGYFETMGTRIVRGRGIERSDVAGSPLVMVVSESMARTLWPGKDALGQCVRVGADTVPCTTVVGVAEDIKASKLEDDPGLFYYLATAQGSPSEGGLFVRVRGDARSAGERIRTALQADMPGASYVNVTPLSDIIGEQTQPWRVGATMFVVFGLLALTLALIGLYSVISFNVGERIHELGVRVALGATVSDVLRLVVGSGMKVAVAGVAIGSAIAAAVGRWVAPLLFQESPHDPWVFASVAVVLLAVASLASFLPARRAARVDPVQALRAE